MGGRYRTIETLTRKAKKIKTMQELHYNLIVRISFRVDAGPPDYDKKRSHLANKTAPLLNMSVY